MKGDVSAARKRCRKCGKAISADRVQARKTTCEVCEFHGGIHYNPLNKFEAQCPSCGQWASYPGLEADASYRKHQGRCQIQGMRRNRYHLGDHKCPFCGEFFPVCQDDNAWKWTRVDPCPDKSPTCKVCGGSGQFNVVLVSKKYAEKFKKRMVKGTKVFEGRKVA